MRALTRTTGQLTLVVALALGAAACGTGSDSGPGSSSGQAESTAAIDAALDDLGLADAKGRKIVDTLDRLPVEERPADLMASVRPGELVLSVGEATRTVPLPKDLVYVSFAPYAEQTHDCFHHSLTTCLGEMRNKKMMVEVLDHDSKVLVDEELTTFDNGFVGLWLPAGIEGFMSVVGDDFDGTAQFSTGPDDPTCVTTLQVERT